MINMDKKEQILHYHRIDGMSLREIARRTGLNRKTVTRYIREYEAQVQSDPEEGIDMCLASKPKYPQRKIERTKLTEAVCTEIEYWLAEHERSYSAGSWTLDINHYITTLMRKPGALDGSVALRQMPAKMQELFRVHFADNGRDFLKLLKYSGEHGYDYKDILDAVKRIRMRGARHINFDQIKVALETPDNTPIAFAESQKSDAFLEIELGSEDVLSQLDGIMQGSSCDTTGRERRCAL